MSQAPCVLLLGCRFEEKKGVSPAGLHRRPVACWSLAGQRKDADPLQVFWRNLWEGPDTGRRSQEKSWGCSVAFSTSRVGPTPSNTNCGRPFKFHQSPFAPPPYRDTLRNPATIHGLKANMEETQRGKRCFNRYVSQCLQSEKTHQKLQRRSDASGKVITPFQHLSSREGPSTF